jgi:hypothetical protein
MARERKEAAQGESATGRAARGPNAVKNRPGRKVGWSVERMVKEDGQRQAVSDRR